MQFDGNTSVFMLCLFFLVVFIFVFRKIFLLRNRKKIKKDICSKEVYEEKQYFETGSKNFKPSYSEQRSEEIRRWCLEQDKIFSFKFCPNCGKRIIQMIEVGKLEHGKCEHCKKEFLIEEILKIKKENK